MDSGGDWSVADMGLSNNLWGITDRLGDDWLDRLADNSSWVKGLETWTGDSVLGNSWDTVEGTWGRPVLTGESGFWDSVSVLGDTSNDGGWDVVWDSMDRDWLMDSGGDRSWGITDSWGEEVASRGSGDKSEDDGDLHVEY
eukprot:TRINITY_DN1875_c0_g1_i1.p2 TRINITY_DN1875_c0_g1~~TRINITY_DN1875_c0_g1_i1.p2  ORF type:complete len:141 (-),score=14.94 TRINITY_DN1875_c0_g1_i1:26-448(-)